MIDEQNARGVCHSSFIVHKTHSMTNANIRMMKIRSLIITVFGICLRIHSVVMVLVFIG